MKINRSQLAEVRRFLVRQTDSISDDLLEGMELKVGLIEVNTTNPQLRFLETDYHPVFFDVPPSAGHSLQALKAFREGAFGYLMIRIDASWQCMIRCKGEILEDTCDEDKFETARCCDFLQKKCSSK